MGNLAFDLLKEGCPIPAACNELYDSYEWTHRQWDSRIDWLSLRLVNTLDELYDSYESTIHFYDSLQAVVLDMHVLKWTWLNYKL